MPTNKPVLKEVDQTMADYKPVYSPIVPLFLPKSVKYNEEVGKLTFTRAEANGDIRVKNITPKDTEIRQFSVGESSKSYKKYFKGVQFTLSQFQDQSQVQDSNNQALDEHWKQFDEEFLTGEGSAANNVINNGLYWSGDSNYVLENSTAIASGDTRLSDFHNKVILSATKADLVAGKKLVMFYGTDILPLFNSLYDASQTAFKKALGDVLGNNYSLVQMPASITPAASGWIVVNMDQVKLHYTKLPGIHKQGVNDEKNYAWWNFLQGSTMLEVLALNGVVRQPATLAG